MKITYKNDITAEEMKDGINETLLHIRTVQKFLIEFCNALSNRAIEHDISKLENPEVALFVRASDLKNLTYGSDEYKEALKKIKPAIDHHYKTNSHHPEYHSNGVNDMTLIDLVEMFCDWLAATERHDDGSIYKSIEHNKDRFEISDQLTSIFKNTGDYFKK